MSKERVQLRVNGTGHEGWKEVRVTAGIERQARDFSLEVTDRWPGSSVARRLAPGDLCEVWLGNDKVLTGYVDATPISYDGGQVTVGVNGRSRTADLVDCSAVHSPGQWRGVSVELIARALAEPYNIKVLAAVATGTVHEHQIDPGESVFESIDRLLTQKALLATDDADGNQVLTRAGLLQADTALEVGVNVLSASAGLDFKDRYSEYRCRGQRAGTDQDYGVAVAGQLAKVADPGIRRRRILDLRADGQGDLAAYRERVRWEAACRAGKSYQTTYVVQGWRQRSGQLWLPNMRVQVRDPIIGFDMEMLIAEVEYLQGETGTTATLTVAPVAAFELLPEVPKAQGKKKAGSKGFSVGEGETLVEFK